MLGVRWLVSYFVFPFIGTGSILEHRRVQTSGHLAAWLTESTLHSSEDGSNSATASLSDNTPEVSRRTWKMRLCNAYAYQNSVEIYHSHGMLSGLDYTNSSGNKRQKLTEESGPLPYKRCADFDGVELGLDSILEFRIGGEMPIGTFAVNDLPASGSLLQLAIKRRDSWSTAADFSSHIFSDTSTPQIALVDAYLGESTSYLEVWDAEEFPPKAPLSFEKGKKRHQEVRFGTVIEVSEGDYDWLLKASSGGYERAGVEFKACCRTMYTVLRVGADAIGGNSFAEELVVWPREGVHVRGRADEYENEKGLFGLPQNFLKSAASSRVKLVIAVGIVLLGLTFQFDLC
jgi:hypothetical protein